MHTIFRQRGVTLVELMIAMVLALGLSAAIITTFTNNRKSFNQDENILRMQDDARFALRELAFDLSMAGHLADLLVPGSVTPDTSLSLGTDCGPAGTADWAYLLTEPAQNFNLSVTSLDNATGATTSGSHSCISGAEFQDGSDVVAIKRVAGNSTAVPDAGQVYLQTNGTVGLLFREPAASPPAVAVPAPFAYWEYRPRIYFVRNYADAPGDGIPTLCRKVLRGAPPSMTTECLAVGVENLQIEFGIDTTTDGNPNVFLADPTLAELQAAVSARISLLARTMEPEIGYTNDKTYVLGNANDYTPGDNFHRRVYSVTVGLKNIRSLRLMGT